MFTAKALHREELTTMDMESKITASIDNGTLLRLLENFTGSMTPELEAITVILKKLAGDITERMQDSSEYTSAVHELAKMKHSGLLLSQKPFTDKGAEINTAENTSPHKGGTSYA